MPDRKAKRYEELEKAGQRIMSLICDCQRYFNSHEESGDWRRYLVKHVRVVFIASLILDFQAFVDDIVIHGLLKTIASSLGYLLDETDQTLTQGVLFEVQKFTSVDTMHPMLHPTFR